MKRQKIDQPDPVDIHVGKRIKLRRQLLHMSQEQLAEAVGVSFQQVQKYESGDNRVSASRLYAICKVLNVKPAYLFEDLEDTETPADEEQDPMKRTDSIRLVRLFWRLPSAARPQILGFMDEVVTRRD